MRSLEEIKRINDEAVEAYEDKRLKLHFRKLNVQPDDLLVVQLYEPTSRRVKMRVVDTLRNLSKTTQFKNAIILDADCKITTLSKEELARLGLRHI